MYTIEDVQRGDLSVIGPDFYSNSSKAFAALGASVNLTIVGVLIVKLNFLLFFRRLTTNTGKVIMMGWWAVLAFTVAGTIAQVGMQAYKCFFGSIDYIFGANCTQPSSLKSIFFNAIFSAVVDAISDFLSKSYASLGGKLYHLPRCALKHKHLTVTTSHCVSGRNSVG